MPSIYLMIREHQTTCAGLRRVGIVVNLHVCDVCKVTFNIIFCRLVACCPEVVAHAAHRWRVVLCCIFLHNVIYFRCVVFSAPCLIRCRAQCFLA